MDSLENLQTEDVNAFAARRLDQRLRAHPRILADLREHDLEEVVKTLCLITANETATMRTEHVLGLMSGMLENISSMEDVVYTRERIDTIRLGLASL